MQLLIATISLMAILYMLGWWYSRGWGWMLNSFAARLRNVEQTFSVPILLKTWFSPWKQIQTVSTFSNFFQSLVDNSISRLIGALLRTAMLLTALILSLLIIGASLLALIVWPILPFSVFILLVMAVLG